MLLIAFVLGQGLTSDPTRADTTSALAEIEWIEEQAINAISQELADFQAFAATGPAQNDLQAEYEQTRVTVESIRASSQEDIAAVTETSPADPIVQSAGADAKRAITEAAGRAIVTLGVTLNSPPSATTTTWPATTTTTTAAAPTTTTTWPPFPWSTTTPTAQSATTTTTTTAQRSTTTTRPVAAAVTTTTTHPATAASPPIGADIESTVAAPDTDEVDDGPEGAFAPRSVATDDSPSGSAAVTFAGDVAHRTVTGEAISLPNVIERNVLEQIGSFLRAVVPAGLVEPIIDLFTLLRAIGIAFASGIRAISWPILALAIMAATLTRRRPETSQTVIAD